MSIFVHRMKDFVNKNSGFKVPVNLKNISIKIFMDSNLSPEI